MSEDIKSECALCRNSKCDAPLGVMYYTRDSLPPKPDRRDALIETLCTALGEKQARIWELERQLGEGDC